MNTLSGKLIEKLKKQFGPEPLALHTPDFSNAEASAVSQVVESTFVSYVGQTVLEFQSQIEELENCISAVALSSGTAALHMLLREIGVRRDDEVILPALSFIATANAVAYLGAAPHFIDVNKESLGLDADALRRRLQEIAVERNGEILNKVSGKRISAIVVVHSLGHLADVQQINLVAKEYGLPVIEDAAGALGSSSTAFGRPGEFSAGAAFSFNGNKIVTTGGGGAVVTNNQALAERVTYVSSTAKQPHPWEFHHSEIGFNYRMPALNAALGVAQLSRFSEILDKKRRLSATYAGLFSEIDEISMVVEPPNTVSNYWLNAFWVKSGTPDLKNQLLLDLNQNGISARPIWKPLPHQDSFIGAPSGPLPNSREIYDSIICVPSSSHLLRD